MSDKVVYAIVRGGLGNQLFIYSAARGVALKNNARVVLLSDSYEDEFHGRDFLLGKFRIEADITSLRDTAVPFSEKRHSFLKSIDRYLHFVGALPDSYFLERRKRLFSRNSTRLDQRFFNISFEDHLFLDGYFQEERYFSDVSPLIREELQLALPPSQETQRVADEIRSCNAVCLHFRRTELESRDVQAKRGVDGLNYRQGLDMSFYEKAIAELSRTVEAPRFFAFSDYPEWMLNHVDLPVPVTFVAHNRGANMCHEDIYLMSLCRHHVISHSTFGWWGAWLSQNEDKQVYAPVNVCARRKSPFYPEQWNTLDVCQSPIGD